MSDAIVKDQCKFSTYGYACGKPVEHGRYLCEEHAAAKCSSCGKPATHGCGFCGQFVCGAPLCDECTYGTDASKSSGAWGFMNHIHVSKPEFADKHANVRLKSQVATLREALDECEAYFDNRADADCDQDGYIPNEEMKLLTLVRNALRKAGAV